MIFLVLAGRSKIFLNYYYFATVFLIFFVIYNQELQERTQENFFLLKADTFLFGPRSMKLQGH
jgi:hypothetical protein